MKEQFARSACLIGEEGVARLQRAKVAVFGLGGVGGFAVEALARAGVGELLLCDNDEVSESNLNRQLLALRSTLGQKKTQVAAARLKDINPEIRLTLREEFFLPANAETFDFSGYDYIVDAIDTLAAKVELAKRGQIFGVPVISAMGAGNKLDPSSVRVSDLYKTAGCPLARAMRSACRRAGIERLKVGWSPEEPKGSTLPPEHGRHAPGSISFVPGACGLVLAGAVIKDLLA